MAAYVGERAHAQGRAGDIDRGRLSAQCFGLSMIFVEIYIIICFFNNDLIINIKKTKRKYHANELIINKKRKYHTHHQTHIRTHLNFVIKLVTHNKYNLI